MSGRHSDPLGDLTWLTVVRHELGIKVDPANENLNKFVQVRLAMRTICKESPNAHEAGKRLAERVGNKHRELCMQYARLVLGLPPSHPLGDESKVVTKQPAPIPPRK